MTLARCNRRVLKQIALRQIMAKDTEANEDITQISLMLVDKMRSIERETTGKLWVETPDGEMRCLGAAYGGYAKDNTEEAPPFWMWNGRVWMYNGYMMELVRR